LGSTSECWLEDVFCVTTAVAVGAGAVTVAPSVKASWSMAGILAADVIT
jgi:hypothetical protein